MQASRLSRYHRTRNLVEVVFLISPFCRRQEIVFIGFNMDQEALRIALDSCLCTADESSASAPLPDPFAQWPKLTDIMHDNGNEPDVSSHASHTATEKPRPAVSVKQPAPAATVVDDDDADEADGHDYESKDYGAVLVVF